MPAYLIANIQVHDEGVYMSEYGPLATASVERHGGRFLARGGQVERLEGTDFRDRVVVLEFDSVEVALGWYRSAEYQSAAKVRRSASVGSVVILDGVPRAIPSEVG